MSQKKIGENGKIPISSSLLNNIFQLIMDRRFSEAERNLDEVVAKLGEEGRDEFKRGFIKALKGIILMYRSNEQESFIRTLDPNNIDSLKRYLEEFTRNSRDMLQGEYDRGYFLALANYIRFMLRRAGSGREDKAEDDGGLVEQ
ncbi:MAG: hypothetical protein QW804_03080 [Candidatus Bathyarchaeia archaeon]|nr:hypothetical protein [Candidatus Bathyarchaeota archaeon]